MPASAPAQTWVLRSFTCPSWFRTASRRPEEHPALKPDSPSDPPRSHAGEEIPAWGHLLTAPCPACGLATHRHHRTLDFNSAHTNRSHGGPDNAGIDATSGEPEGGKIWIGLIASGFPTRYFAEDEIYHLPGGIARLGQRHRVYGTCTERPRRRDPGPWQFVLGCEAVEVDAAARRCP
ncbi:hypothetical protein ACFU76_14915 [Streptomyces sp. NPDC057539]|uniref:hypothetical protein n=1 Tax=Streptomyces sp. NPDC057539 TaxID=3346159 RepID=UPI003694616A